MTPSVQDMSHEDMLVASSLQLEDLELTTKQDKGKYAIGKPTDHIVAINEYRAEIDRQKQLLEDQRLASSIAQAVHTDAALLTEFASQDVQAYEDRDYALQLSSQDAELQDPPGWVRRGTESIRDWMSTVSESVHVRSLADFEFTDDESEQAGPSTTYAERQASLLSKMSERFKCNACLEHHHVGVMVKLSCPHRFCGECTKELFLRSTKDQTLFPPSCCQQNIPLELVKKYMLPEEVRVFEAASIEFTTKDKTYCSNGACNKFIPPATDTILPYAARCKDCATITCTKCKGAYHHRRECPKDFGLDQAKELARNLGWQECPQCHSFVELRSGCYHMTCRCKAEFCYLCGVEWCNCECIRADAHRIEERAVEIVDRDNGPNIAPIERARLVNQVRNQLLEDHECTHSRHFKRIDGYTRGGHRCEICDTRYYKYILQCRRCFMNVCEDCRRHRI